MKKLAKLLLVVMLVSAFALVLTACTKTDCELGKHDFTGTETVTKEATCTEKGSKTIKCKNCDETTTVEIDALGHDYAGAWTVVAGKHSQACSRTGCTSTQTHDPDMGAWAVVEGKHVQTCTKCSVKGEHDAHLGEWTVAEGKHVRSCTETGCTIKEEHNADMGKWSTKDGQHVRKCGSSTCTIEEKHNVEFDETTLVCKGGCGIVSGDATVEMNGKYYKTLADAVAAVEGSDEVTIKVRTYNAQTPGIFVAASRGINVVIDLDRKAIVLNNNLVGSTGTVSQNIHIEKGNTFTFKNGIIKAIDKSTSRMLIQNYSNLTLDNVTLDGTNLAADSYTLSNNASTVRIKGESKIVASAKGGYAMDACYNVSGRYPEGVEVIVEDGVTIDGKIEYSADVELTGWMAKTKITLPAAIYDIDYRNGATAETASITIAGKKPSEVIAVGNQKSYTTLAAALADGGNISLAKDIVIDKQLVAAKDTVLDLNGKTISNTVDLWVKGSDTVKTVNSMLQVESGANVVITGNGKILAKENDCYTINIVDGTLVIESGEFRGNITAVQVQKGTATIKGGKFSIAQHSTLAHAGPYDFMLNCIDQPYKDKIANIVVEGGEFVNFNPANNKAEGANTNFMANGCTVLTKTVGSDTVYAVAQTKIVVKDYAAAHGWTNSQKYPEMNAGILSVTMIGTDDNTGKYYDNGFNWRAYQTGKATITISVEEGYTIASVKITYTNNNDGILLNGESQVNSEDVITVNGSSIVLKVGNSGTKTNGRVDIVSIEVVYAPAAPQA